MEQRRDMLVVGSAGHVALLDPRRQAALLLHLLLDVAAAGATMP